MPLPVGKFEDGDHYRQWIWVAVINTGGHENPMRFAEDYDSMMKEVAEYIKEYTEDFDDDDPEAVQLLDLLERDEVEEAVKVMGHKHMTHIDIEQRTMRCAPPTVEEQLDHS
jgi:hypothetical protein